MSSSARSSWWDRAACRSSDPGLFFPGPAGGDHRALVAAGKAVCGQCAIRPRCLDYALEHGPVHGLWGGTTESERRALAAARPQPASAG